MKTGPNIRKRGDGRYEARYPKGRNAAGGIRYGFVYGSTFEEAYRKRYELMTSAGLPIPDRYLLSKVETSAVIEGGDTIELRPREFMDGPKEALSEEQAAFFDEILWKNREPRRAALYVCLHMGLTQTEVTRLRFGDFDFVKRQVLVAGNSGEKSRTVPIPSHVESYLRSIADKYPSPGCYLVSGMPLEAPPVYVVNNALRNINAEYKLSVNLSAAALRGTFVRRMLDCGASIATISELIGVKPLEKFVKRFAGLFETNPGDIERLSRYVPGKKAAILPVKDSGKRMNLLILGAGGEGHVVRETAEAMGIFNEIAFLDDVKKGPDILGTIDDAKLFVSRYPIAFVGIGANHRRRELVDYLESLGFIMPVLIHPSAGVSGSAMLEAPCIVEAKSIINMGVSVGRGCIISSGSIIDRDAVIGEFAHIDVGVTVAKASSVPPEKKLTSSVQWNASAESEAKNQ